MLLPSLALNLLLAYPLYGLCRRLFRSEPRERRVPQTLCLFLLIDPLGDSHMPIIRRTRN